MAPVVVEGASHEANVQPRPKISPLASDRYLVRVTLSAEAHDNLRRAQELMRHIVPNGDPAVIVEKALALLVGDLERAKLARVRRPPAESRSGSRLCRQALVTFRPRSDARSGRETRADADLLDRTASAPRPPDSNSIT